MFVVWAIMVPLIASSYLTAYLKRRRTGRPEGDWTFVRNRRAVGVGVLVAVLLAGPSFTSLDSAVPALLPAIILGGVVAMALNRYGPFVERAHEEETGPNLGPPPS